MTYIALRRYAGGGGYGLYFALNRETNVLELKRKNFS